MDEDGEFEVTADMLIHGEVDDEQTLEEEEALQCREEVEEEVDDLQKESEMPIEQLLALYGYGGEAKEDGGEDSNGASEKRDETSLAGETSSASETSLACETSSACETSLAGITSAAGRPTNDQEGKDVQSDSEPSQTCETKQTSHEEEHQEPTSVTTDSRISPLPSTEPTSNDHGLSLLLCDETLVTEDGPLLKDHKLLHTNDSIRLTNNSRVPWANAVGLSRREQYDAKQGTATSQEVPHNKRTSNKVRGGDSLKSWLRPEVPERRSMRLMISDEKAAVDSYFTSIMDSGSDSDEEYLPNEDWKEEIKVGPTHQAVVPDHPTFPPYVKGKPQDNLLWSPRHTTEERVSQYLKAVSEQLSGLVGNNADRDNEQALQALQQSNHTVKSALEKISHDGMSKGMQPWTEEECRTFEAGLRTIGKDFFQLRKQVPTRTVKELVQFYYLWKKTERYDAFMQLGKIGKKKISCPPGQVSDLMDRFLDVYDTDDLHYGTTSVYAEVKKEGS